MASIPLEWRTNLRANLVLWPEVAPNIVALAGRDGEPYDEEEFLRHFPRGSEGKPLNDPRSVRNTVEVLALAGLAYRDDQTPSRFRLSDLGRAVLTFLGVGSPRTFANAANRPVIADVVVRGLSVVVEYRAIWMLMRRTGGLLSNEELNRSMTRIKFLEDVPAAAEAVLAARQAGEPTRIGARLYENEKYADADKRLDQRKAINPLFLLAGGGRLFLSMDDDGGYRRLEDWAIPLIDRRLEEPAAQVHADTDADAVRFLSDEACVPSDMWREP